MVLLGTLVNGLGIVLGTLLGNLCRRIPESMKATVMQAIGLAIVVLGVQMGLKSNQFLLVILSLVLGGVIGEWLKIEENLTKLGAWIERKVGAKNGESKIAEGFVTATLIFVVGAMAIIGALDSGIRGNHNVLYTKAVMDGFISLLLSTTLGLGVIFSAIPVVLYQGTIALFAAQINQMISPTLMTELIAEMTATGGVMILGIGLNLMGITKVKVANLLPAILLTIVLTVALQTWM
ncbi:DUF554 domain-containing protein [Priestia koreensis]|uniref:DUF554 domain-containing protein n=1 Tax=Priestia koreensis TaxID=284581 RepID=A0A0M0KWJ2_9BACI|nr:DUF554 domain-containing protein [Priestia koreensis]KOO42967.1 hypothetical protein AMD01_17705 [Priestia koreensis]